MFSKAVQTLEGLVAERPDYEQGKKYLEQIKSHAGRVAGV
jgi:hypothetical protein